MSTFGTNMTNISLSIINDGLVLSHAYTDTSVNTMSYETSLNFGYSK